MGFPNKQKIITRIPIGNGRNKYHMTTAGRNRVNREDFSDVPRSEPKPRSKPVEPEAGEVFALPLAQTSAVVQSTKFRGRRGIFSQIEESTIG